MKQELKFRSLTWKVEKPSKSIDFLDLTIELEGNGTVNTKTYVKPLCLHLYIPPRSSHPKGVIKSLIFGTLRRFWIQNSRLKDFESHVTAFIGHLINRGYTKETLLPIFLEASESLNNRFKKARNVGEQLWEEPPTATPRTGIFVHWEHHPRDIGRQTIRQIFDETLTPALVESQVSPGQLTIAYSVPRSIGQCLTKTQLEEPPGYRVSSMLEPME